MKFLDMSNYERLESRHFDGTTEIVIFFLDGRVDFLFVRDIIFLIFLLDSNGGTSLFTCNILSKCYYNIYLNDVQVNKVS